MKMSLLDWAIMAVPLLIVMIISWHTKRHMRSVADFLSAGRLAGRYLVGTSVGTASFGAITAVMVFEIMCRAGLTVTWWEIVLGPFGGAIILFLAVSGFVIYRYRETRALTLSQLFEIRYSRNFRIMAGSLCFISGLINFAIFPAVSARFFVNYIGLPQSVAVFGHSLPTFGIIMPLLIGLSLYQPLTGGQLSILVSDAVEGLISGALYLIVAVALLMMFDWHQIFQALTRGHAIGLLDPRGQLVFGAPLNSKGNWLVDPFDSPGSTADFNIWYAMIGAFLLVYTYMAWQGNQGFNCSAANPHEAKMGNILGNWRAFARIAMITLLGLCALTVLRSPHYSGMADRILADVNRIDQPQIRSQMLVPVTLGHVLPVGIKGCFAAIMLFAMLAGDGSYMHSWGSIFIQDVVMPLRKTPLTPREHVRLLRWSIVGVAVFAFLFSLFFKMTDAIALFFNITGAIFAGGAGSVIIGGLYWKRGTTAGAWGAMLAGAITPILGMGVQQMAGHYDRIGDAAGRAYWLRFITLPWGHVMTGREVWFLSSLTAIAIYIAFSLITCREPFNMDKMLHRGPYAVREDQAAIVRDEGKISWAARAIGWDKHFTRGDKWISGSLFAWLMASSVLLACGTIWNVAVRRWTLPTWSEFWWIYVIIVPLVVGAVAIVWLTWGVMRDLRKIFKVLRNATHDDADDGVVVAPPK
jgi:solute:Na+ symporter, SSS family